ncbi:Spy/CpxP family protein refolding chaperone [Reyranella sp.]|uniref:Spy/CpxP family protein refolding chaperone n=1 Tax=Reyranella sp. TaxID=1929291 RepID=UPI003BAB2437
MAAQPSADACLEMSAHKAAARTYLKLRLDLDKQQAPLWNELEAIAAENDTAMLELCTDRPANPEGRSLVARSERAEIRLDRRLAALKALNVPLRKLYATLSAEQRAVVDALPMPLPF